jgi:hypothetical protein
MSATRVSIDLLYALELVQTALENAEVPPHRWARHISKWLPAGNREAVNRLDEAPSAAVREG